MTETIPWLVQIWYRDDSGEWRFNGNGVLVDNKSVLTCKHVIETHDEGLPAPPEDLEVRVGGELNKNVVCDVVRSESEDLALLRLEQVVPARLPDFCTDVQKTDVLGVRAWQSRGKAVELQAGESIQCTEVVRDRLWYFDNGIPGGFSGSPLLLDSKRRTTIVGVIEQGGKGKVKSAVIPPSLVCEFLESQDVPVRKKARWFWLARNILVSTVLLLATLGFLLSQTLGKRGLLIGAAVSGLALAASVWVAAAAQKGERTSDHLLYPFLRWLDERKIALMVAAAFCLMIEPALLGWWKFMHEPKVVTLNIVSAAKNTSSWVTNKLNIRRAPARELARAIPASTELDVVLLGNVTPSSAKANSNYQGRVVNDALVQDGQGAVVPKGTPVTVRAVADGSSVRFELTQISLNGTSFNTVSSAGTNRETGAIMEVSVVERGRVSGGLSHAKIGGVAGWFTGLAMGHKGKRIQTATQMSSIGAQIGSKLGADGSTIQTVDSIPPSQVLAFRLSQPVDLKP